MLGPKKELPQKKKTHDNLQSRETDSENVQQGPAKVNLRKKPAVQDENFKPTDVKSKPIVRVGRRQVLGELPNNLNTSTPRTLASPKKTAIAKDKKKTVRFSPEVLAKDLPKPEADELKSKPVVNADKQNTLIVSAGHHQETSLQAQEIKPEAQKELELYILAQITEIEKNFILLADAIKKFSTSYKNFHLNEFENFIDHYIVAITAYIAIFDAREKVKNIKVLPEIKTPTNTLDKLEEIFQRVKHLFFPLKIKFLEDESLKLNEIMHLLKQKLDEMLMQRIRIYWQKIFKQLDIFATKSIAPHPGNVTKLLNGCSNILKIYNLLDAKGLQLKEQDQEARRLLTGIQKLFLRIEKINIISKKMDTVFNNFWTIHENLTGHINDMAILIKKCVQARDLRIQLSAAIKELQPLAPAAEMEKIETSLACANENIKLLNYSLSQKLQQFYINYWNKICKDLIVVESIPVPNKEKQDGIFSLYQRCEDLLKLEQMLQAQGLDVGGRDHVVQSLAEFKKRLSASFLCFDSRSLSNQKDQSSELTAITVNPKDEIKTKITVPESKLDSHRKLEVFDQALLSSDVVATRKQTDKKHANPLGFTANLAAKNFSQMEQHSGLDWKYSYASNMQKLTAEAEEEKESSGYSR